MPDYDKLVRDDIPAVIRANGQTPVTHVAEGDEYRARLREKLVEEAKEFREDPSAEELADVLTLVDAIRAAEGFSAETVATERREKRTARGGFEDGIVLERVLGDGENES
ncbi:nucleoside triphosphate pyrophosphohydrolase [Haloarchaeobius sp. HME9146]|uniref:nucleoside triphosphate pyrophosphohydrolase n=1 Tax=Haloarchaeobius sp. HME9146 TaxID=2978732 RepID=UPI0021BEF591|nr:nucleoside triphosphate pyrophosphohydrolase [Haloarchaeobius sp. HME9146]MCT9094865.1 nucleoside triphosphate pyrophosphohydrolase [Haloarchaeobius sp. HME9146]